MPGGVPLGEEGVYGGRNADGKSDRATDGLSRTATNSSSRARGVYTPLTRLL